MTLFFQRLTPRRIIWAGCLLTLLYALFSNGVYHIDEHFQILEFANMKLFGSPAPDQLPWEYQAMMRPGLQPFIAYAVGWLLDAAGIYNPFLLAFLLRLLSGAMSVAALLLFYRTAEPSLSEKERKWFLILSFFLWFMAYTHVRFSAEVWGGIFLLLFLCCYFRFRHGERRNPFGWGIVLGVLAGAAFCFRYQVGFALAGFGLWLLVFAFDWRLVCGLAVGLALMLGAGTLYDYWLYGAWTCAPINYLTENVLNSHMDKFGVEPWYYYLLQIPLQGLVLFGLPAMAATLWYFVRHPKNPITWTVLLFIAAHLLVGRKDIRFLFPVLPFAPYFVVLMFRDLPARLAGTKAVRWTMNALLAVNTLAILYNLAFAGTDDRFYRTMWSLSAQAPRLVILQQRGHNGYYGRWEDVIGPRPVRAAFYLPPNARFLFLDDPAAIAAEVKAVREADPVAAVFLMSEERELTAGAFRQAGAAADGLTVEKVAWSPYPQWVTDYLNFNDWVSRSAGRMNVYRLDWTP